MLFAEDTDATNELINDGQFVQPLTLEEIEALKQSGVHATVNISCTIRIVLGLKFCPGHHQKTNRAACELFAEDGIQQGEIQETQGSQVCNIVCYRSERFCSHIWKILKIIRNSRAHSIQCL